MIDNKFVETIKKQLKNHNQNHLLTFWEQLNEKQQENLLLKIKQLNLPQIDQWVQKYVKNISFDSLPANFTPAPSYSPQPADQQQAQEYSRARSLGRDLIGAGKVAAFVVAGGQGTRLGFDGPKGNFHISPVKNKTLFQIFAEIILAASNKYGVSCPWYIMTSPLNHDQTIHILGKNDYYGLNNNDVFIFQQGTLPNFDMQGKILLADKGQIAASPDGHGGSLRALYNSGAVEDMKKRGVEFISYFQVDNPLINIFDPLFIGLHASQNAEMSSKAVLKTGPKEKVGNFCLVDGRVTVIEYSDLPDELAEKRDSDGSLMFQLGSIAIHIINRSFVEKLNAKGFSLPMHRAVKKIPYIDTNAKLIEPVEPNGIKLESFVFDALPLASRSIILQTLRSEEFAPVKNATGVDSAETAKKALVERAAKWLESAGIAVPRKPDGSTDVLIEIAPSFALEKDDLLPKAHLVPEIKHDDKIYLA